MEYFPLLKVKEMNKMKIIISNKARKHMEAHKCDFILGWEELIRKCEMEGKFDNLNKDFEKIKVEFSEPIGYCSSVITNQEDEIIYAKRIERDTYTRFVKNRNPVLINSLIIILNRNRNNTNEYYLVTMFPDEQSYKEPEDINILSKRELVECLNYWSKYALIYDEKTINTSTLKTYCPYKNLYLAIA